MNTEVTFLNTVKDECLEKLLEDGLFMSLVTFYEDLKKLIDDLMRIIRAYDESDGFILLTDAKVPLLIFENLVLKYEQRYPGYVSKRNAIEDIFDSLLKIRGEYCLVGNRKVERRKQVKPYLHLVK